MNYNKPFKPNLNFSSQSDANSVLNILKDVTVDKPN